MPSFIREKFACSVVREILSQLRSIASSERFTADFAQAIEYEGSASIEFDDGKHDPDAQFRHSRARYSGVIIEVSYPQKRKDLARLADDYTLGSGGDIRVVVGSDIEYRGKKATLSAWRPRIRTNAGGEEELIAEPTLTDQVCLPKVITLDILALYSQRRQSGNDNVPIAPSIWNRPTPSTSRLCHPSFGRDIRRLERSDIYYIPSARLSAYPRRGAAGGESTFKKARSGKTPLSLG